MAIAGNKNFAFETNFTNDLIINLINDFRNVNYKISLFYFGIDSLEDSVMRVQQRINTGGHAVSPEIAEYNFYECPKRVLQNFQLFDYMTFIDGVMPYGRIIANFRKKDGFREFADRLPKWFAAFFNAESLSDGVSF